MRGSCSPSGRSTIRVPPMPVRTTSTPGCASTTEPMRAAPAPSGRVCIAASTASRPPNQQLLTHFTALGAVGEELEEYQLVALDVPPGVDLVPLHRVLRDGAGTLWWYEEACVGPEWPA